MNDDWEVRRFDDPYERIRWDNALEYDQLVRIFLFGFELSVVSCPRSAQRRSFLVGRT